MRFAIIVIASVFVLIFAGASSAVAQEWIVDRVSQPSHYTRNEAPADVDLGHGEMLLVAAQAEEEDWVELRTGMTVPNNSLIRTGRTGRLQLRRGEEIMQFKPRTMASVLMWEHEGSTLTYIEQTMGSLLLDVETRETKHTMVETPYLAAVVKGTRFTVQFEHEQATLRVEHGVVEAIDVKRNERVDVRPLQSVRLLESNSDPMTIEGPGIKDEVTEIPFQFFDRERRKGGLLNDASYDVGSLADVMGELEESDAAFEALATEPGSPTDNDLAPQTGEEGTLDEEDGASTPVEPNEINSDLLMTEEASPQIYVGETVPTNLRVSAAAPSTLPIGTLTPMEARPVASTRDPLSHWQAALTHSYSAAGGHEDAVLHAPAGIPESFEGPLLSPEQDQALGNEGEMPPVQTTDGNDLSTAAKNAPVGEPKGDRSSSSLGKGSDEAPSVPQPYESEAGTMVGQELEAEEQSERQADRKAKRLAEQGIDGGDSMIGDEPRPDPHEGAAADTDRAFYVFEAGSALSVEEVGYDLGNAMDGVFQLFKPDPIRIWMDSATIMSLIETNDPFLAMLRESSKHRFSERFRKIHKGVSKDALFGFTAIDSRAYDYRELMHDFGESFSRSPQKLEVTPSPIPVPSPALLLFSAVLGLRVCRMSIRRM